MAHDTNDDAPPVMLRRLMLALTMATGLVAAFGFVALVLTALFGGEGESRLQLAVIAAAAAAIVGHSIVFGRLLLRRPQPRWTRVAVLAGGVVLLALSGAAVVAAGLDDSPGGVLGGILLALQGAAAVLTVAFPRVVTERPA